MTLWTVQPDGFDLEKVIAWLAERSADARSWRLFAYKKVFEVSGTSGLFVPSSLLFSGKCIIMCLHIAFSLERMYKVKQQFLLVKQSLFSARFYTSISRLEQLII
jgi:hypothetical protein